jgi:hypothetical protein
VKKLKVDLKNCYGIKSLEKEFDFSKGKAHIIYAPNGSMKSSFAKVFSDIPNDSKDRIHPERETTRMIVYDTDTETDLPLLAENIFVIESHNIEYESKKQSTLLANSELKELYEDIHNSIEKKKDTLLKSLKTLIGAKDCETLFTKVFAKEKKEFYACLEEIQNQVNDTQEVSYLAEIKYQDIVNADVSNFLKQQDVQETIAEYIEKYNELLEQSPYFQRGAFNHSHADAVCVDLENNGFLRQTILFPSLVQ